MKALRLIQDNIGNVDIELNGGSMAVDEVTEQNQYLLLKTHPGEWKEHPIVGVGIDDLVNDHDIDKWKRAISEALEQDGQMIEKLELTTERLTIVAKYRQ
ncbi:MAG: hypothetical protein MJZ81_01150 [Bacteroidales bacterium]|nr:hypothetical protein [Bacteroidales bacterium]